MCVCVCVCACASYVGLFGGFPVFRRFFAPKVHCSEGSLFRRFVVPKVR